MMRSNFRWCLLAVVLGACSSGRNETVKAEAQASSPSVAQLDAGTPVCQPRTCQAMKRRCGRVSDGCGGVLDCGACPGCGPEEMDCCGACIPKSEGRCPENIHCKQPPPEM
ncbi:hypothetical protein [Hyalangium rubrum]|uniref:Lipoprotein n=1 Tax=Hyalangium rubrum TaxID=3103134 RepID=A0ABU5HCS1_9BACT|nr:hypothetical protein [Hyalangium sp. s54d21]MDY7231258.1 hypothetical protein [Hyalangium sp. s54d21]